MSNTTRFYGWVHRKLNEVSINETTGHALQLNGQIAESKTEIPSMGWYAFVRAPEKNVVGLHESIK